MTGYSQPAEFLEVACNYGCGQTVYVDTDYDEIRNPEGWNPKRVVYEWLGKRVLDALIEHHSRCTAFYNQPDGKPWLRVVQP